MTQEERDAQIEAMPTEERSAEIVRLERLIKARTGRSGYQDSIADARTMLDDLRASLDG